MYFSGLEVAVVHYSMVIVQLQRRLKSASTQSNIKAMNKKSFEFDDSVQRST